MPDPRPPRATLSSLLAAVLGAACAAPRPAAAPASAAEPDTVEIVIAATTDVHGHAYHWDYVRDQEAPWGVTRAATVLDSLRKRYPGRLVTVDAGDLIQGNPFAAYFALERRATPHPVVAALGAAGYDLWVLGNHEFNFGLEVLTRAVQATALPALGGNVQALPADTAAFPAWVVLERQGVRILVAGFTTPGAMVWDRTNLAGRVRVAPILPEAARVLAAADSLGTAVRVVVVHSGLDGPASYDTTGVGDENVAARLAQLPVAPHVVVVGHSHRTMADSVIGGVHFVQPAPWARSLAVVNVALVREVGSVPQYRVAGIRGELVPLADVPPDSALSARLAAAHAEVRQWVARPLARVEGEWTARYARAEDTPIIDFVNEVQRRAAGAELSATAAFNPAAAFGPGSVRLRDLAGLYPYENTLKAVRIDGAALRAYLERSAAYFRPYRPGAPLINDSVPGYNFDIVSGVEYAIDLARPLGERIRGLSYRGRPVTPADTFTLALNNYRQGGGGGFAMLAGLPVVYDRDENIRELLADRAEAAGVLRARDYFTPSWRIVPAEAAAAVRAAFAEAAR